MQQMERICRGPASRILNWLSGGSGRPAIFGKIKNRASRKQPLCRSYHAKKLPAMR